MLIPNFLLDGKKLVFSITKPFDLLLKTSKCEEWWERIQDARIINNFKDWQNVYKLIDDFLKLYNENHKLDLVTRLLV